MAAPDSRSPARRDADPLAADRLLFIVLGVAAAALALLFAGFGYGRDQGIYATVAGAMARGGAPYLDAWDFKPPAIFVVYGVARLFGSGMLAVRLVELAAYASLLPAFMRLSRHWVGSPRPGVLAAFVAFYAQFQLEYWDTAQPESFAGVAVAWALVCATRGEAAGARTARLRAAFGTGVAFAFAGLLKPHLGTGLAVSAWMLSRSARRAGDGVWAPVLACSAGAALTLLACASWLVAVGAWSATVETFAVFLPAYHALRFEWSKLPLFLLRSVWDTISGYTFYLPAGLLALASLPPLGPGERRALLHLGGVLVLQLAGVAYQGRFYPYHFGASLTLLSLPAAWGLWKLWERARVHRIGRIGAFAALGLLAIQAPPIPTYGAAEFWQRVGLRARLVVGAVDPRAENLLHTAGDVHYGANRMIARWIGTSTPPDSSLYVWGFEPMIYEMSARRPATRWIYNVPQRLDWEFRERARQELMDDLRAQRPAAIVLVEEDRRAGVTGSQEDSRAALEGFPELQELLSASYRLAYQLEDFEVHLRLE